MKKAIFMKDIISYPDERQEHVRDSENGTYYSMPEIVKTERSVAEV